MTYYNDNDKRICAWLRELIKQGCISDGVVDDRPIQEVRAVDLVGFRRVHLFAGIAGWDHALNLAGFTGPVWTGSCPCQPFSVAGKGKGIEDARHLWPFFRDLIEDGNPSVVLGEQVASKAGREWYYDCVRPDLAKLGYIPACSNISAEDFGAPHKRQRLYWIAHSERNEQRREEPCGRQVGRVGRVIEPFPWDEPWEGALSRFRAVGDGLPRLVAATDGARNAIVPQVAAHFIQASLEAIADASFGQEQP